MNPTRSTRISVVGVHSQNTPADFIETLYQKNLSDMMSLATFDNDVEILSKPWKASEKSLTVTLEMPEDAPSSREAKCMCSILPSEPDHICRTTDAVSACRLITGCMSANMNMRFVSAVEELGTALITATTR